MKQLPFIPQAIIFDMDGVITNTMPDHFDAWRKAFAKFGIGINYYDIYLKEGQKGKDTAKEIFSEKAKRKPTKKLIDQVLKIKEDLFKKRAKPKLIQDIVKLINFLSKKKIKLALVTGTSKKEVRKILPRHVVNKFEVVVTADEVSHGKPNPQPYRKAVKKLNIDPKESIVIENAPFGIKSAQKVGIYTIAITTSLPKKYLRAADLILSSISKLKTLLSQTILNN
jgi:beta-phosphoglucomutase